jgi:hypothetical protein
MKYLLDEKCSLPPKLRTKSENTMDFISQSFKYLLPLLERSPDLHCLSTHAHRALVSRNVFFIGGMNGNFIAHETNAYSNPTLLTAVDLLYGRDFMIKCIQDTERYLSNGNLYKLMLFVLMFSSNCSIVVFNDEEDLKIMSTSIELICMQNIYVTMLWKYLVYLYGYNGAVIHFSLLVKNVLDMFVRAEEVLKNLTYNTLIDRVAIEAEHSLIIAD